MKKPERPVEIIDQVEDISIYDTIYLGFPIWWYQAPSIIYTFLKQYELKNVNIIPFVTSGTSELEDTQTMERLAQASPDAKFKAGKRFAKEASEVEIIQWVRNNNGWE
jgi:hypothetical protein